MKVLFIGGTGNLSRECTLRALAKGLEVYHLNRGSHPGLAPDGVVSLIADMGDEAAVTRALGRLSFDAVVDFIAFRPERVESCLRIFRGRTAQYVLISSASVYRKPPLGHVLTEATPLGNPYWDYSRDKIACERVLTDSGLGGDPAWTIIRPSHTYGLGWIPTPFGSSEFTVARRILDGKEIVIHGDGQALWTLTHARDFAVGLVGLLGNPAALGEAVQVTGDEALTWEAIHACIGAALGKAPRVVHVPSDFIAKVDPERGQHFLGDKTWSSLFDCSKLKRLVPEFRTTVGFHEGIRESVDWLLADPSRQRVNPTTDAAIERILAAWKALSGAA
jgi:nucleoside-diphosphate-sugar epimerase